MTFDHIDSLIELTVDLEVINWHDSTHVRFISITHNDDTYELKYSNLWLSNKYRNLGGPIIVGNVYSDSSVIYPIFTKMNTSYFLMDDFENVMDSSLSLSITESFGEYDKNQEFSFYRHPSIELRELTSLLSTKNEQSGIIEATQAWYTTWVYNHPSYKDQRTIHVQKHLK